MNKIRAMFVLFLMIIPIILVIIRLVNIQVVDKEKYAHLAEQQQTAIEKIKPEFGLIFDRNNNLFVYNRNDVTFYLDLNLTKENEKDSIARIFSKVLGKSKNYYLSLMNKSKGTIILERKVKPEFINKLTSLNYHSLYYVFDPTRIYHYGSLASHLLGYVNKEHKFISGVSEYFSTDLEGIEGYRKVYKNSLGQIVSYDEREMQPAIPGNNLILTIDRRYQGILEEELKSGIEEFQAHSATGIIMNPNNGEILALANVSDYDPNYYWLYDDFQRRNRAITDTYEPGSTFKAFTFAALLEKNLINLKEKLYCENGVYKFQKTEIRDVESYSHLTSEEVFIYSSNIGTAKLIQKINNDEYYKFLRSCGFGNLTSIQLKGEATGNLKKPTIWSSTSKSFISFGYEISVTPIQLITAFSALINGGVLYKPQLVLKKLDFNGNLIEEFKPETVRTVISETTSSIMRNILSGVVKKGTGKRANIEYISVGGKTGTSQKLVNGSYSKEFYNTSFVGFFPVEDPQVVILIHFNSPQKAKSGGSVAAPVFKKVAERIIDKDYIKFEKYLKDTHKQKLFYSDYLSRQLEAEKFNRSKVMPDLRNKPLSIAIETLNNLGVSYKVKGDGFVINQSLTPGKIIQYNEECILECNSLKIIGAVNR